MADIEVYEDTEGIHWPDAQLGSEKYYGVSITRVLAAESDAYVDVTWTVPAGLTNMDTEKVGDELRIKLSADATGEDYEVICEFNTTESGNAQKFKQKMFLSVV